MAAEFSITEAAEFLKINPSIIRRAVKSGRLNSESKMVLREETRITPDDLKKWNDSKRVGKPRKLID